MVLPCASVMVIIVLLNEALTCAPPDVMFFFSRLRTFWARGAACSLAIHQLSPDRARRISPSFRVAGDCLGRALARARIRVRTLPADGQPLAMAQAAVAAEVHQTFDVCDYFAAQ